MDRKRLLKNFVGIKNIKDEIMVEHGKEKTYVSKEKVYIIPMKRNGIDVELRLTRSQLNELSWLYERLEFVDYLENIEDGYDKTFKDHEVSGIWDYVKDDLEELDSDNYDRVVETAINNYYRDEEGNYEDDAYDKYKDMMLMREHEEE